MFKTTNQPSDKEEYYWNISRGIEKRHGRPDQTRVCFNLAGHKNNQNQRYGPPPQLNIDCGFISQTFGSYPPIVLGRIRVTIKLSLRTKSILTLSMLY